MSALENTVVDNLTPSEFYLSRNFPDPFKEKTTIKYCIAYKTNVRLEVLDREGNLIKKLVDEEKEAGAYEIKFDTVGIVFNSTIQNGILHYRLSAGDYKSEKRMTLLK